MVRRILTSICVILTLGVVGCPKSYPTMEYEYERALSETQQEQQYFLILTETEMRQLRHYLELYEHDVSSLIEKVNEQLNDN